MFLSGREILVIKKRRKGQAVNGEASGGGRNIVKPAGVETMADGGAAVLSDIY